MKGCGLVQGTEEKVTKSLWMQKLEEVSAPSSNVGTDSVGTKPSMGPQRALRAEEVSRYSGSPVFGHFRTCWDSGSG